MAAATSSTMYRTLTIWSVGTGPPFLLSGGDLRDEQFDANFELVGGLLEGRVAFLVGVPFSGRVRHAPVRRWWPAGKLGTDLSDLVAKSDDPIDVGPGKAAQVLGRSSRDVD